MEKPKRQRAQSAMEYLMTYGWSILIIAVVLGALFQLGAFGTQSFAPKAQPGSCKVVRLGGPGTTTSTNLQGVCNNLRPQFIAQFNGASSYVNLGTALQTYEIGTNSISFAVWYYLPYINSGSGYPMIFGDSNAGIRQGYSLYITTNPPLPGRVVAERWVSSSCKSYASPVLSPSWHFFVATFDGSTLYLYVDGALSSSGSGGGATTPNSIFDIGADGTGTGASMYGYGSISNFQVYSTSLDAASVNALYREGIGGVPITYRI
jgi:hypothetical protein